ncbi:dolichyl-phosphate-mannose--protein mannosyltransferase [Kitasatospora sp. NPDC088391]|uniref:dolichyl-phosphate-mannose--protein mannosyltransferase n=1 Tax=Kitasatospora sp. NPDC088391 TaxID=3364074 RepID=UPI003812D092
MSRENTTTAPRPPAGQPPLPWAVRLRRAGYVAPLRTSVHERLVAPWPDRTTRRSGWVPALLVALFAGLPRFWRLDTPRALVFDETYYAKDAWSMLRLGYEGSWPDRTVADPQILADPQTVPLSDPGAFVAHPPAGKWVIALGEWMFGLGPFGWRFAAAALGTLSVLMLCRIGRRLFRSTLLGCLAGALMAVDGLHLVLSRTALLDLFVMVFALAAFGSLLLDRDRTRARLAATLADRPAAPTASPPSPPSADRAGTGPRPWRLAAGAFLGLSASVKWNGLYFLAAFLLLTLLWDAGARRTAGARHPYRAVLRRDTPSAAALLAVAALTYLATWTGWFRSDLAYGRHWADGRGGPWSWIPAPLRSLWHYEAEVYRFNIGLHSPHSYQSNPWSWPVLGRPVLFHHVQVPAGTADCPGPDGCVQTVLALGTPLLWWSACAASGYLLYRWALRRDWRSGAVLCGAAAGYLPWFLYQDRTVFSFYAVVLVPFLCLALTAALAALPGPPGATATRRLRGTAAAAALVLLIGWNFADFLPLWTARTIPYTDWRSHLWLGTWF